MQRQTRASFGRLRLSFQFMVVEAPMRSVAALVTAALVLGAAAVPGSVGQPPAPIALVATRSTGR
jgi:hypothetical protein